MSTQQLKTEQNKRPIPETTSCPNRLVICEDDYQLFQTLRFVRSFQMEQVDILLSSNLEAYKDVLTNSGLFNEVIVLDVTSQFVDEHGKIIEESVADLLPFSKDYGTLYYYNIDDAYSLVFYHQVKRGVYAKVICLDGGGKSYLYNLKKPNGKGYGCNLYDYIESWYSDDPKQIDKGQQEGYVCPMPEIVSSDEMFYSELFHSTPIKESVILEYSEEHITHQEFYIYEHIMECLKDDLLMVTKNERLKELCQKHQVRCEECLRIPATDVLFHGKKLAIFTDNVARAYQLLWRNYSNIQFVDLSRLLINTKVDSTKVANWFKQYKNYYFISEWRKLQQLLDVMR